MKHKVGFVSFFILCSSFCKAQQSDTITNIIADNAQPVLVSKQFMFTEGPAVDKKGNIFFTDQPNDKIWKYGIDGKLSLFLDKTGRSNGLYFDKKGNIIACADNNNELWSISPEGAITVLMTNYESHKLNGPNDLWVTRKGGIFFTDPYYQRDYWERKKPDIATQDVYYLPPGKKDPLLVAAGLTKPNGIVGTKDGKYLYVADIGANKTYRYRITKNGTLTDKQLFVAQGADGITLDNKGNLYLCGNGITVYNAAGKKIAHIAIPEKWTANACFGGKHRNVLFITASEAVYTLQMKVKGIE
ncbi:SMP-30/gluconolactonase/LRE family protein [Chitinophagaceae bacterium LWZ2-11]